MIDSLDVVNENKINYFYDWLNKLGGKYNVITALGNHDINKNKNLKYYDLFEKLYDKYINDLKKCNINLVMNDVYEDKNVRFVGFNLPASSYYLSDGVRIEKDFYGHLDMNLFISKKNKVNIAVIHSPINIFDDDISNILRNFDIILTGHMHNGLVFSWLDKLFGGNRGLVAPNKKMFPKYARNISSLDKGRYLIISGGIYKLSESSGIFNYFNFLYPMEIDEINIKKKVKK